MCLCACPCEHCLQVGTAKPNKDVMKFISLVVHAWCLHVCVRVRSCLHDKSREFSDRSALICLVSHSKKAMRGMCKT